LGRLLLVHPYELLAVILNPTEFLKKKKIIIIIIIIITIIITTIIIIIIIIINIIMIYDASKQEPGPKK
jgi:hypothetical protein